MPIQRESRTSIRRAAVASILLTISLMSQETEAFQAGVPMDITKNRGDCSATLPNRSSTKTNLIVPSNPQRNNNKFPASSYTEFTSYGVASDWGVYSAGMNDGLLSPRTVKRLDSTYDGSASSAVSSFLHTYKNDGPMACLPFLSDPIILPELTRAMRDSMVNLWFGFHFVINLTELRLLTLGVRYDIIIASIYFILLVLCFVLFWGFCLGTLALNPFSSTWNVRF